MLKKLQPLRNPRTPIRREENEKISRTQIVLPEPPDIRKLRPSSGTIARPSSGAIVPKLNMGDKIHQKFKSEYNSFMNSLLFETQSIQKEEILDRKEDFLQVLQPQPEAREKISKNIVKTESQVPVPQTRNFVPEVQELCPKDLDFSKEEVLNLQFHKNDVQVFYETGFISYKKARENTDTVIFVLGPEDSETLDASEALLPNLENSETLFLFIAYSKKQLYEEYIEKSKTPGGLPLYFILDLIEEESYHVPMSHIVRILEYPHPMYLIEKTSSFHIYLTRPCKL
jgi:hypothetical protein